MKKVKVVTDKTVEGIVERIFSEFSSDRAKDPVQAAAYAGVALGAAAMADALVSGAEGLDYDGMRRDVENAAGLAVLTFAKESGAGLTVSEVRLEGKGIESLVEVLKEVLG